DKLNIAMDGGETDTAYHFVPQQPNGRLVVLHQGHGSCMVNDGTDYGSTGFERTLRALLSEGYGVLVAFMPHYSPENCVAGHDEMFNTTPATGSPMKYFLEPVAVSLNYLKTQSAADGFPAY